MANNTQKFLVGVAFDHPSYALLYLEGSHITIRLRRTGQDGHKRLTMADEFAIVGGSQETHERMTETLLKTFEDLKIRRKSLNETSREELRDLLEKHTLR